ncbi:MAG: hypothetical protein AAGU75_18360 [Bacillota bacterium]
MEKNEIIRELKKLITEGDKVLETRYRDPDIEKHFVRFHVFISWRTKILSYLSLFLAEDNEFIKAFNEIDDNLFYSAKACIELLNSLIEYIKKDYISTYKKNAINVDFILNLIFSRFHKVARQLRSRYADRPTLEVEDEYDVQDLLYALLQLFFDDIRKEEWTPSYAGGCARQDFLLKENKTVIEIKKTRANMSDRNLGEQLIIDIDKYKSHPDCKRLICFVYDPEGRLGNPQGIINDLNQQHEGFVKVYIKPN